MIREKHYDVIVEPLFTEKATIANEMAKYTFKVAPDASKIDIKDAVEKIFDTKVSAVNVLNMGFPFQVKGDANTLTHALTATQYRGMVMR